MKFTHAVSEFGRALARGESLPSLAAAVARGALRRPTVRGGVAGAALGSALGDAANRLRSGDLAGGMREVSRGFGVAAGIVEGRHV